MDAFLWSVNIACYDADLIIFRLNFQIMSKIVENNNRITGLMKSHCADFLLLSSFLFFPLSFSSFGSYQLNRKCEYIRRMFGS